MIMEITHRELAPGVTLSAVRTTKFKTSLLGLTFLEPLTQETAAANALIPSILRRGTREHPKMEDLSAALDELYGGAIEPMVRKKGETQCIGFAGSFLDDAYALEPSQILEKAAALLGEMLLHPAGDGTSFQEEYLESEKQNLVNRIRSRINDKQQYAMYRLIREMCAGEPYGVDKLGEEAEAAALTGEALWKRYQDMLETAPLQIYYCGSAPADRVEEALRSALNGLPNTKRREIPGCLVVGMPAEGRVRYVTESLDVTQGKLSMGFRLGESCTQVEELAPVLIFNAVFGGSTNSKLFLNVRERLSLCYYASSAIDKQKGLLLVSSGVAFEKYESARDEILAQLDDCRKGRISQEELESARRYIVNQLRTTLDSQGRLEDYWLGQVAAGLQFPPEELAAAVEKVTGEQVRKAAASWRLDSVYFLAGKEGMGE
ncbi:MAG: Zinc protease [Firmicutes bacterium]|nr:Zinc protease [Bacillota bacterium]